MPEFTFLCETRHEREQRAFRVERLIIAGWTGRDRDKMEEHMAELEVLGIKRPSKAPIFYRASAARLTAAPEIEVLSGVSSGEAEALIIQDEERLWVGVASDHTDRGVEAYDIAVSKQMCDKPCGGTLWPFEEVAPHWDLLVLSSQIAEDGQDVLYQEAPLSALLDPERLIGEYRAGGGRFGPGTAMLCGTPPARGGIRGSSRFEMRLHDPVLERTISSNYAVREIPSEE